MRLLRSFFHPTSVQTNKHCHSFLAAVPCCNEVKIYFSGSSPLTSFPFYDCQETLVQTGCEVKKAYKGTTLIKFRFIYNSVVPISNYLALENSHKKTDMLIGSITRLKHRTRQQSPQNKLIYCTIQQQR